jgi:hypothetical protein
MSALCHTRSYRARLATRFGRQKNVTTTKKILTSFTQPGELVVPAPQVVRRKLILTPNKIPDEPCQTLAVSLVVLSEIENWKNNQLIEPETCTDQTGSQRPGQVHMGTMRFPGFQDRCHAIRRLRMPQDCIPIRCNKHRPAALLHDAERLGENAADVGDLFCDLRANNSIKRNIGLGEFRGVSDGV